MKNRAPAVKRNRSKLCESIGAMVVALGFVLVAVTPASAAETYYLQGNWVSSTFYGSIQQPSLTGGRAFHSGVWNQLTAQTTYNGVMAYSVTTLGSTADLTHGRINKATARCRWLDFEGKPRNDQIYMMCKYYY